MKEDEIRWDKRYQLKTFPETANDLIRDFCHLGEKGRALDIAAGNGRNAAFLSDQGFWVDAVEISGVAINLVRKKDPLINCIHEDLDHFTPQPDAYDLIVNINFLNRRLFPHIKRALRKNGILIFQTFLDRHFETGLQPAPNRDYYLHSNELLHTFLSLQVLFYKEEWVVRANGEKREAAKLVARKTGNLEFGG